MTIQIQNYEILEKIGQGSYGIVYKAQNPISGDLKAIKVLQEKYVNDERARDMFLNEARIMANFSHPNIVAVYNPGLEPVPHFFMDYHPGSLEDKLNEKPLKVDEAVRITKQLIGALGYAHKKGVVHRDVWPPNILLDEYGNVKLADFGIAKLIQQTGEYSAIAPKIGTGTGSLRLSIEGTNGLSKMIGALNYASPEMKRGEEIDARTDIYSAGVVLDEMLTGFVGGRESPSEVNPDVPEYLDVIVDRAIQSDKNRRYKSAAEFLLDFDIKPEKPREVEVREKVVVRPKDYSFLGTIGKWVAGAGLLAALTVFSVKGCSSWTDARKEARFSRYQNEYVLVQQDFAAERYAQADKRLEGLIKRMAKDSNPKVAALLSQAAKYNYEKIDPEIKKIEEQRRQAYEKAIEEERKAQEIKADEKADPKIEEIIRKKEKIKTNLLYAALSGLFAGGLVMPVWFALKSEDYIDIRDFLRASAFGGIGGAVTGLAAGAALNFLEPTPLIGGTIVDIGSGFFGKDYIEFLYAAIGGASGFFGGAVAAELYNKLR